MHTSFRLVHTLLPFSFVALALACTESSEESSTVSSDEFVIEDDGEESGSGESESGEGESSESQTTDTGDTDTTDASTTTTTDADTTDVDTTDVDTTDASDRPDVCGNGQMDPGEDCDGADLGGASCASEGFVSGTLACNADCTFDLSDCNFGTDCGNGQIDLGEQCDGMNLSGFTCQDLGYGGGQLLCDPFTCVFDLSNCTL